MSKNVRIDHESTVGTYSGISMIKTNLIEGGVQRWVPVDEYASYLKKGEITITENGTYSPADHGWDAFTQVTVEIGDNENYDYDVDGSEPDPGYEYLDPDTGLIVDPADVPDNPIDNIKTNKYKGTGTVTGKNPSTGEPTAVSTDANGNIQLNEIPERITIVVPPTTTIYSEGDTIDFTGIKVGAFKASGTGFPLDPHETFMEMDNIIPFDELTFPVTIATTEHGDSSATYPSSLPTSYCTQPIPFASSFTHTDPMTGTEYAWTGDAGVIFFLLHNTTNDYSVMYSASKTPSYIYRQPDGAKFYLNSRQTYKGQSVYCFQCGLFPSGYTCSLIPFDATNQTVGQGGLEAAYIALYGIITGPGSIPVQWQTDYQTEPYEDTFNITVT